MCNVLSPRCTMLFEFTESYLAIEIACNNCYQLQLDLQPINSHFNYIIIYKCTRFSFLGGAVTGPLG